MLPMQSVDLAVDEMRYAREKLGMQGGFLRPNPYHGRKMVSDPMYEAFWTTAEDLDTSIAFTRVAQRDPESRHRPVRGIRGAPHDLPHDGDDAGRLSVIWGGVCDHHPQVRIAFIKSGGGWIAPWLDRMDRHFDDQGFNESAPKTRP